jgi:hypothetical protein
MATDPLTSAWQSYRPAIDRFYNIAGPVLEAGPLLEEDDLAAEADAALESVARYSVAVREACEQLLVGRTDRSYDEIVLLLVAAAAVDTMVAKDALRLGPEMPGLGPDERFTEDASDAEREAAPRDEILAEADDLFAGSERIGGAASPSSSEDLRNECIAALDNLVDVATKPALRFTFNALTFGADFGVTSVIGQLNGLIDHAGVIRRRALRLLVEGVLKVIGPVGEGAVEWALDLMERRLHQVGAAILGGIAARDGAQQKVIDSINAPPAWVSEALDSVSSKVSGLEGAYGRQMKWTGRVATGMAQAAPLVSTLAGPIGGPAVVIGVNLIGVGFVVYTLTIRIGSRSLPHPARVAAVVDLVGGR